MLGLGPPEAWRLTARGMKQAQAAGRWLHTTLPGKAQVFTSPFERAVHTAELLGLGSPIPAPDLADRDWGDFFSSVSADGQDSRRAEARRLAATDPWDWCPYRGESARDVFRRVARFLRERAAVVPAGTALLIVSHGEVLRAARMVIEGTALSLPLAVRPDGVRVQGLPNAGLVIYEQPTAGEVPPQYRCRCFVGHPADGAPAIWTEQRTAALSR